MKTITLPLVTLISSATLLFHSYAQTPAPAQTEPIPNPPAPPGQKDLRLNFRGAPLDMVLSYLSEAAGFVIVLETEVKGRIDVWSNHTLSKDEAVELLNSVLNKNGYAALQNGRTLTIVSKDEARKRDIPVKSGANPTDIPKNDLLVTQIIPVRFINAVQVSRDLQPLLPEKATLTANEGGNALVITDTQANIRRMAEIIKALDTAISSTSAIGVFKLKFADAKALATVIRDLFQTQDTNQRGNNPMQQFFRGMRGGPGGDTPQIPSGSSGSGRVATPKVVASSDERSNSLIVSAPDDQMPLISNIVAQVDINIDAITELRVFRLKYADPQETADLLANLFPNNNSSASRQGSRGQVQFGGPFDGGPFGQRGGFGQRAGATEQSAWMQAQTTVVAVPDLRTSSVIVSASRELMDQIAAMIAELDSDPAKKQKVFVFSVENTDPEAVQQILEGLFPNQNYGNFGNTANRRQNTRQQGNQLNNRANQMQNQGGFGTGFGNSGFGGNNFGGNRTGR